MLSCLWVFCCIWRFTRALSAIHFITCAAIIIKVVNTLMDVTDVDNPKTYDDVDACVAAHDDREISRLSSLTTGRSGSKRSFNS